MARPFRLSTIPGSHRLVPTSLTADCYRTLRQAILNFDLIPGTTPVEPHLAAQFGISKTPVREALARLAGEGLVVMGPARRTHVAGLSREKARELYQLRIVLECASIRDVTPLLTDDDIEALVALRRTAYRAYDDNDPYHFIEVNEQFHLYLIDHNANGTLVSIARGLFEQIRRVRMSIYRAELNDAERSLSHPRSEYHDKIIEALRRRDGELAAERMQADIQWFLDRIDTPVVRQALDELGYRGPTLGEE